MLRKLYSTGMINLDMIMDEGKGWDEAMLNMVEFFADTSVMEQALREAKDTLMKKLPKKKEDAAEEKDDMVEESSYTADGILWKVKKTFDEEGNLIHLSRSGSYITTKCKEEVMQLTHRKSIYSTTSDLPL